jgi:glycosyltransferase involved in cell wall biosynthesis
MREKNIKVLLVVTAFTDLYISGYVNRFTAFWKYIASTKDANQFHFLTNKSLWDKMYGREKKPNESIIRLNRNLLKFSIRIFYPLYVVYTYKKYKCTSVHIGPNIIDWLYLVRVLNFFKIPHCLTFASSSIEMAGYGSKALQLKLSKVLNEAHSIDILNPTHQLHSFKAKKYISPCSFPYILHDSKIDFAAFAKTKTNDIVFCGSFINQKNPILALQAFEAYLYANKNSDARLIFIGKGELLEQMKVIADKINTSLNRNAVVFENYNNLLSILATSKIFLSLQDFDNYPSQSIMEAMLFENYIISLNNGDTKKLVKEELGNVVIENKDSIDVSKAISNLLSYNQPNAANKKLIQTEFTVEKFYNYFVDIHKTINDSSK